MTNLECAMAVLASHRDARGWDDQAVANDLLAQLSLDPKGTAKNARVVVDPNRVTEGHVAAAEAQAKEATDKASALRAEFEALVNVDADSKSDAAKPTRK